jgi:CheY-like chemotaxis protein
MSHAGEDRGGQIVLIVEDHADLRRIMKEVLEYEGYQALTATNGLEALRLLETLSNEPAVIMSDIVMDDMDGCQLFQRIRATTRWRDVPFIFVSGKTEVDASCPDLPGPADGFIEKPFTLRTLVDAVAEAAGC